MGDPSTLTEVCAAQHGSRSLTTYPCIFDLMKTDTMPEAKDHLDTLTSLDLKERPALLTVVVGTQRHVWVLWVFERLPVSFTNPAGTDGKIVAFSRDMVEGTLPPTIMIKPTWWYTSRKPFVSSATASQALSNCTPAATNIPAFTAANDRAHLPLAALAPLQFVYPLLAAPYLYSPAAYTLLTAQAVAMRWEEKMAPLLTWIRVTLLPSFPSVTALPPIKLADHITVIQECLLQTMVPTATPVVSRVAPTIIMQAPQRTHQLQYRKKDTTPAESWELQQLALTRLCNVQSLKDLPRSGQPSPP